MLLANLWILSGGVRWDNQPGYSPDTPGTQTYRSCCIGSPRSPSATPAGRLPEAPERTRKRPLWRVSWLQVSLWGYFIFLGLNASHLQVRILILEAQTAHRLSTLAGRLFTCRNHTGRAAAVSASSAHQWEQGTRGNGPIGEQGAGDTIRQTRKSSFSVCLRIALY